MILCEYGCNQESKYQFKNGKWCCSKNQSGCPGVRKRMSESNKGKNHPIFGTTRSEETKNKIREANKGKKRTKIQNQKMSKACSLTIIKIKEKYFFFSQIEEMRYNPDKPEEKEIQVHCKYNGCKNSKEKGGWFTPSRSQLGERIRHLESENGNGGSYFYCSEKCKEDCPLFNLQSDPLKETELPYTYQEKQIFNKEVLERQRKEDGYNFCEKCYSAKDLHVHHEKPVKTYPILSLDPDNGIVLCEKCHYKYGHKTGTECSTGNLANKIQLNCNLGSSI